jgi:hypothetical protein
MAPHLATQLPGPCPQSPPLPGTPTSSVRKGVPCMACKGSGVTSRQLHPRSAGSLPSAAAIPALAVDTQQRPPRGRCGPPGRRSYGPPSLGSRLAVDETHRLAGGGAVAAAACVPIAHQSSITCEGVVAASLARQGRYAAGREVRIYLT